MKPWFELAVSVRAELARGIRGLWNRAQSNDMDFLIQSYVQIFFNSKKKYFFRSQKNPRKFYFFLNPKNVIGKSKFLVLKWSIFHWTFSDFGKFRFFIGTFFEIEKNIFSWSWKKKWTYISKQKMEIFPLKPVLTRFEHSVSNVIRLCVWNPWNCNLVFFSGRASYTSKIFVPAARSYLFPPF